MNKKLFFLIIIALLLRLALVYFQYSGDIRNHLVWGQSILDSGTIGFYSRQFAGFNDANYPPLMILFFATFRFLYQIANGFILWLNINLKIFPSFLVPLFSTLNMQAVFLKLPAIFADLGIGYLIFILTKNKFLTFLYLFNPAVIYVSAVWGQVESIPLLFLILSYYLLSRRHYFSHFTFALALLSKQTALWVLPIFLILWIKHRDLKTVLQGLTLQLAIFILFYFPFTLSLNPFPLYLSTLSGSSTFVSDQAMNLWYFIFNGGLVSDNVLLLGLSVRIWSLFLLAASGIGICVWVWRKFTSQRALTGLFWISMIAFFLQTRVHDRHLAPAIPFLLITTLPNSRKIPLYFILSTYHFINLYLALRLPFI